MNYSFYLVTTPIFVFALFQSIWTMEQATQIEIILEPSFTQLTIASSACPKTPKHSSVKELSTVLRYLS